VNKALRVSKLFFLLLAGLLLACSAPVPTPAGGGAARPESLAASQTPAGVDLSPLAPTPTAATLSPAVTAGAAPSPSAPPPRASRLPAATPSIPLYGYRIVRTYPHDRGAFTQGLVFFEGVLYESTGRVGQSSLRKVALDTGEIAQIHPLSGDYFGEGIAVYDDRIVQLTWRSQTGFVYDRESFRVLRTFHYPTEGWGMAYDGRRLIMSDGTATLHFWDPESLVETGQVQVTGEYGPVTQLNELEVVQGSILANVWLTNYVAIIDPQSGRVTGWIDLSGLLSPEDYGERVDVLNGIAYDAEGDRLFVTGKLWPKLFEIELVPDYPVLPPILDKGAAP